MKKSPFPGMDPYLEPYWSDIHTRLITYICEALQPCLPESLFAQAEESVLVDESIEGETRLRWMVPDVALVSEPGAGNHPLEVGEGVSVVAEPLIIEYAPETHRWVEIMDLDSGGRVVTVIEAPQGAQSISRPMIESPATRSPSRSTRARASKRSTVSTNRAEARACSPFSLTIASSRVITPTTSPSGAPPPAVTTPPGRILRHSSC